MSSSRRGNSYHVEEYIDDSVYIPLLTDITDSQMLPYDDKMSISGDSNDNLKRTTHFIEDVDIEIAETKVEIAQLELKLLKLERRKQKKEKPPQPS